MKKLLLSTDLHLVSDTVVRTDTGREMLRCPKGTGEPLGQPEQLVILHLQYCLRDLFGIRVSCGWSLWCLPQCECQPELVL